MHDAIQPYSFISQKCVTSAYLRAARFYPDNPAAPPGLGRAQRQRRLLGPQTMQPMLHGCSRAAGHAGRPQPSGRAQRRKSCSASHWRELEPRGEIAGMIRSWLKLRRDAKISAEEHRAKFGDISRQSSPYLKYLRSEDGADHAAISSAWGCCACIQSVACCALLAAVKMALGSSFRTLSHEAT